MPSLIPSKTFAVRLLFCTFLYLLAFLPRHLTAQNPDGMQLPPNFRDSIAMAKQSTTNVTTDVTVEVAAVRQVTWGNMAKTVLQAAMRLRNVEHFRQRQ